MLRIPARVASGQASTTCLRRRLATVIASDPLAPAAGDVFRSRGHEFIQITKDELPGYLDRAEVLVVRSGTKVTRDVIEAAPKLRAVGRAGSGVDNIDTRAATEKGVLVINTPGGNSVAAAELTITLLMAMSRNVAAASSALREGRWERKEHMGTELTGKRIGIIGLGRIGRHVASTCSAFGMDVIGYDPVMSDEAAAEFGIATAPLKQIFAEADYITVHCPLTSETHHLLNDEAFASMKDGVRVVNAARGGIVDDAALLRALKAGKVAGAALDVFEQEPPGPESAELINHPGVVATPHLGASTEEAQLNVAIAVADNVCDALEQKRFVGVVNASGLDTLGRQELKPFVGAAEMLGSLKGQFTSSGSRIQSMRVHLKGASVTQDAVATLMRAAVLKGLFSTMHPDQEVNYINAPALAEQVGLEVELLSEPGSGKGRGSRICIEAQTDDGTLTSIGAAVVDGSVRVIDVDGFPVDLELARDMIFFRNDDRPGVLRDVTAILGEAGVNIANFGLGRHELGGDAVGVVTIDAPLDEAVVDRLRGVPNIKRVTLASLPRAGDLGAAPAAAPADGLPPKPARKPASAQFSSGPTKKRPGWGLNSLVDAAVGRSHRSAVGKAKLQHVIDYSKELLGVPDDYKLGIVPGSDTGAFEMAMWSMLGARPVDTLHWESFGKGWYSDCQELGLEQTGLRSFSADYGQLPDLSQVDAAGSDVVFAWNGTTSGVRVPNADWIPDDREGLTFVDATSAVFAQDIDFSKCDVLTYSWQKALGGEGAHGMLMLSPRAVERLETFQPPRPLPKVFRLTKGGKLIDGIFKGATINTPSMLAVEDCLDSLRWAESVGGAAGMTARADANLRVIEEFVDQRDWIDFLAQTPETRSNTSVCLSVQLPADQIKRMVALLAEQGVAVDIGAYRDAPPGLRIWTGATVEEDDVRALMPWLQWAYEAVSTPDA